MLLLSDSDLKDIFERILGERYGSIDFIYDLPYTKDFEKFYEQATCGDTRLSRQELWQKIIGIVFHREI